MQHWAVELHVRCLETGFVMCRKEHAQCNGLVEKGIPAVDWALPAVAYRLILLRLLLPLVPSLRSLL